MKSEGNWRFQRRSFDSALLENLFRLALLALALLCVAAASADACGPFFPNNLLDSGDQAVLVAPVADFQRELERMKFVESEFAAKPLSEYPGPRGFADQSSDAERTDLAMALKKAKVSDEKIERICSAHAAEREKLAKYAADFTQWRAALWGFDGQGHWSRITRGGSPTFPNVEVVSGLPEEIADYFTGAVLWRNPATVDKDLAREQWERLLTLSPANRHFKSTWAAFMLGKSWETNDAEKAIGYFQQVRQLAAHGFADSVGLAAASLGLEARIDLKQRKTAQAIRLYLEQFATGDETALSSLRQVAQTVLSDANVLRELARDEIARKVITAYLISRRSPAWGWEEANAHSSGLTTAWLNAVEEAGVTDIASAEKLALAAYQAGQFELALRWINRSKNSPVSQWLEVKLLLRAGRVRDAAGLLAQLCPSFPMQDAGTNVATNLADCLFVEINPAYHDWIPIGRQALGELGVLHLTRREFIESLDALLRSGYWMDASYVAERVLTTDELKNYVDNNWPLVPDEEANDQPDWRSTEAPFPPIQRARIRNLLARRLVRENRFAEARPYSAAEYQTNLDTLVAALKDGWGENVSSEQRAKSLFTAAKIVRTNGMELSGTELEPDWAIYGGNFESGLTAATRTNWNSRILFPAEEELERAAQHHADPEKRFHYRYQAAALAWEAAMLMPDNSDETARVLCTAGTWLKYRDPPIADIFYKALVRRCRKTAIGDQADRMRWFPELDEKGEPKPHKSRFGLSSQTPSQLLEATQEPSEYQTAEISREYPIPGHLYIIHAGDTLADIAGAARVFDPNITVESVLEANPSFYSTTLRIGQQIIIPNPDGEARAEADGQ